MEIWPKRAVDENRRPAVSSGARDHGRYLRGPLVGRSDGVSGDPVGDYGRSTGWTDKPVRGWTDQRQEHGIFGGTPCRCHEVSIRITAGAAAPERGMKPAWTIAAMRIRPPQHGHGGRHGSVIVVPPALQGSGSEIATPSNSRALARLAARLPLARS